MPAKILARFALKLLPLLGVVLLMPFVVLAEAVTLFLNVVFVIPVYEDDWNMQFCTVKNALLRLKLEPERKLQL